MGRGLPYFTWGWKQIQFPKHCAFLFLEYRAIEKVKNPSNSENKNAYNRIFVLHGPRCSFV
jgi:hypothetical protein